MVNEKMVVSVRGDGVLVHVDPERAGESLTLRGRAAGRDGSGRAMRPGWICVAEEAIATAERLSFWIGVALEVNDRAGRVPQ